MGIVNGTTNFILTRMADEGTDFATALAEAQELGYAEADPTADISGADAASKASILASLAFATWVGPDQVYREGIAGISPVDLAFAAELGYTVRLLAIAQRTDGGVSARVHPAMVPLDHPLAAIRGSHQRHPHPGPGGGGTALRRAGRRRRADRHRRAGRRHRRRPRPALGVPGGAPHLVPPRCGGRCRRGAHPLVPAPRSGRQARVPWPASPPSSPTPG